MKLRSREGQLAQRQSPHCSVCARIYEFAVGFQVEPASRETTARQFLKEGPPRRMFNRLGRQSIPGSRPLRAARWPSSAASIIVRRHGALEVTMFISLEVNVYTSRIALTWEEADRGVIGGSLQLISLTVSLY